jgi:hypothetical protein
VTQPVGRRTVARKQGRKLNAAQVSLDTPQARWRSANIVPSIPVPYLNLRSSLACCSLFAQHSRPHLRFHTINTQLSQASATTHYRDCSARVNPNIARDSTISTRFNASFGPTYRQKQASDLISTLPWRQRVERSSRSRSSRTQLHTSRPHRITTSTSKFTMLSVLSQNSRPTRIPLSTRDILLQVVRPRSRLSDIPPWCQHHV